MRLQPLLVTPRGGHFLIICGERRYRAAKIAKLIQVPCIIRPGLEDTTILELSITKNLQREDLTPIDQARAIKTLMDICGYSQAAVARKLGLSPASVNYKVSLLELSSAFQGDLQKGDLTETQGRTIIQELRKIQPSARPKAMTGIRKRMRGERSKSGRNLNTQAVRNLVRSSTGHVPVAAPRERTVSKSTSLRKKTVMPGEKAEAQRFADTVSHLLGTLRSLESVLDSQERTTRFAQVLLIVVPRAIADAKGAAEILKSIVPHFPDVPE